MKRQDPRLDDVRLSDEECVPLIAAFLDGDGEAEDRLCRLLLRHARLTVAAFLRSEPPELDDLVQETVIAVLGYLRRRGGFHGSLVNFTITVARNRCRNYRIWKRRHPRVAVETLAEYLGSPEHSPLDALLEEERRSLLQEALDRLEEACRTLLRALFLEGRSVEDLRREAGLRSFQSIYYRRARCLEKAGRLLKSRLASCSSLRDPR
jgi:RNA polymerase sigma factor (sigma-70 family)